MPAQSVKDWAGFFFSVVFFVLLMLYYRPFGDSGGLSNIPWPDPVRDPEET
jgi:hypothetical protein